ncbi:MAG: 1-deoxy-D-xylulose-5-phosphate reductoisomerase [Ruminococcus sp.]|nr:1-deoxy-D-xylulose-5-phosphate reductoisomerase [Ruminococcus sp.]MCD7773609.1 1-deoxy-D-xylulose-5-phosphate reductoisomerase [Ruminococcus sp.]
MEKTISILGSTGSIGTQCLDIVRKHGFKVAALTANKSVGLLINQALEFKPKVVCIMDKSCEGELSDALKDSGIKVLSGMDGLCEVATLDNADILVNSLVGMVGLTPTLLAIDKGRDIALANKETLVTGGKLVTESAKRNGVRLFPIDSEHSAIFQCLQGNENNKIKKIILTASGGPFYGMTKSELSGVTVEQALNHPNWSMGSKITIDSATLMNKGLEFIEAMWLFGVKPSQIEIVVHRESVIHSAVEYEDNSIIAQMGVPDMKIPIQYSLLYPKRIDCPTKSLSLTDYGTLHFSKPDYETFDCLSACIKAIKMGGIMPTLVNGVNEAAVELFLNEKISFLKIGELVKGVTDEIENKEVNCLDDVLSADRQAREYVRKKISGKE